MKKDLFQGTVITIRDGVLTALISNENTCKSCGVRTSCSIGITKEKQIQIPYTSGQYKEGDTIKLLAKTSMKTKAAFFAFILPLMLMLIVLFAASFAGKGEDFMALAVLLAISGYYVLLYFFRDKLKQKFTFIIQ